MVLANRSQTESSPGTAVFAEQEGAAALMEGRDAACVICYLSSVGIVMKQRRSMILPTESIEVRLFVPKGDFGSPPKNWN